MTHLYAMYIAVDQHSCGFYLVAMAIVPFFFLMFGASLQEDVFSAIGRPIIDSCMCGYNGTIFA